MTIELAKAARWCPESGRQCWPVRLGSSCRAHCPECGRWLRPRITSAEMQVLPYHLPVKPRRGR